MIDIPELDLILTSARVDTGEHGPLGITAIGVRDGRIAVLGNESDAVQWPLRDPDNFLSFVGATICAGLSDAHSHPVHGLLAVRGADLGSVKDPEQLTETLAKLVKGRAPGEWIIGWNLRPEAFGDEPHRAPLDRGAPENPVFIRLFDFHAGVANARALEASGVIGAVDLPGTAEVVVDASDSPTGYLKEMPAMALVEGTAPAQTDEERADALLSLLGDMAASGLTATHSLTYDRGCAVVLDRIERQTELPLRVRLSPVFRNVRRDNDFSVEEIIEMQGTGGRRWTIEGVKFFLDGTIDNGTAWLRKPDSCGESTRSTWDAPEDYARALERFHEAGVATATHAIGDAAVQHALRVISTFEVDNDSPKHRIEHVEIIDDELVREFAASGAIASMQPAHAVMSTRANGSSTFSDRLEDRVEMAFRVRSLLDEGTTVAFGSDWPIGPFDPRAIMAMARTRNVPRSGIATVSRHEAVSARQALAAYTEAVAEIHGVQGKEGVVAVDAVADFTVFAADPLVIDPEELSDTEVLATFIGGHRV